ncbi:2-dehydro-3-deoxygluconokinase [Diplonema papillatum]|nr:2-dehydro-3-deoxygluconokinase [Diplonema papillatum]
MRVVVLGDVYHDIVAGTVGSLPGWGEDRVVGNVKMTLGGSAANTARHLASLEGGGGGGVETFLLGAIGDDTIGKLSLDTLRGSGLVPWWQGSDGLHPVAICEKTPTGTCVVLSGKSDRAFVSCNGANDAFDVLKNEDAVAIMESASHIHVHGYYNCASLQTADFAALLQRVKKRSSAGDEHVTVSLDTQYDAEGTWKRENLKELLQLVDVFLPNEVELVGICSQVLGVEAGTTEQAHDALIKGFPHLLVVVKAGEKGCLAGSQSGKQWVAVDEVEPVDTTGAGDAWNAGFLYNWLTTNRSLNIDHLTASLQHGNRAGGIAVQRVGACDPPLTHSEVFL